MSGAGRGSAQGTPAGSAHRSIGAGARQAGWVTVAEQDLADSAATERLGADLSLILQPGDVVALSGDLGAGKSTLARALIRTLAKDTDLEVPSPTYTLVQPYETEPPIAHFDLYRIASEDELEEIGFAEARETGPVLVEWPDRASAVLEAATIAVELALSPGGGRHVTISTVEEAAERVARTLAIRSFLADAGLAEAPRLRFFGDASARRYETVEADGTTLVLMDAPRRPDGPPIKDGLPYSRIAHLAEDVTPFVAVAQALSKAGFAAPAIHRADLDAGLLLIENLGDGQIIDANRQPIPDRYEAAIACIADLHGVAWPSELPISDSVIHRLPHYDRQAMEIEVALLVDWYLPHALKRQATADERTLFHECWQALFAELEDAEISLVLRDFHSPNVIFRPEADGLLKIGLIDFQDALLGPSAYDVASLAQDARVDVSPELEATLTAAYVRARREADPDFNDFGFERDYAIMAAQRASKILGIFVRLLERDGKPQYLRHIPRIKGYLTRSLGHPSLSALRHLYASWGIVEERRLDRPS
ncbi:tRNA (adenosine(37)-N6)-threonylcarbamoyltransferase complex ATPase subunit type 1 TsaE [Jiella marina]|uniref:tRNA (adenosine(37)-N6)-threonylcarbamoyltransferase complex ATPase subunit type 1 TsaE n=1 Tax=Jiella sp. LLJ827 TaxID=2917712 RepID=UPI00210168C4|nr:tRNA (adenosine(37)-N6)-threonylcarbamoyltransferase complex ATPase subunit type 1 TsaE [Jiella sp. LLJ827]MCQ0987774.1 tRNA (adenosine(37)-N6)-threonylcarbamoyltransferase complex ATPase subunit type 1 TsaE [Jiella sp. LLJ827]